MVCRCKYLESEQLIDIWHMCRVHLQLSRPPKNVDCDITLSESFEVHLIPRKLKVCSDLDQCNCTVANVVESLRQPFQYRRRNKSNQVSGAEATLVAWTSLHSSVQNTLQPNRFVLQVRITLTCCGGSSDGARNRASRHISRLANRCDCRVVSAHRTALTLCVRSSPPLTLSIEGLEVDKSGRRLSVEEEEQLLAAALLSAPRSQRAFILHKPVGVVSSTVDTAAGGCSSDEEVEVDRDKGGGQRRPTVFDVAAAAGFPRDCALVGRLDAATAGLLLFTDDSRLARAVRDPIPIGAAQSLRLFKTKEYVAVLLAGKTVLRARHALLEGKGPLSAGEEGAAFLAAEGAALVQTLSAPFSFRKGGRLFQVAASDVSLQRTFRNPDLAGPCPERQLGWCVEVRVRLAEGKHHQIRRAVKRAGYLLLSLTRVAIAGILSLESISRPGQGRWLSAGELHALRAGLGLDCFPSSSSSISSAKCLS